MQKPALAVVIDGAPLPDDEARAFWGRFSAYMDAHKGDLAGFAAAEKLASVHPETRGGRAVLVGSRTAPQRAYANAPQRSDTTPGGSAPARSGARGDPSHRGSSPKKPKKTS
jgi:hypothetical protein